MPAEGRGHGRHRYGAVLLLTLALAVYVLNAPETRIARLLHLVAAGAVLVAAVVTSRAPVTTRWAARKRAGDRRGRRERRDHGRASETDAGVRGDRDPAATSAAVILAGLARVVGERGVILPVVLGALAVYVLVGLVFAFAIGAAAVGGAARSSPPAPTRRRARAPTTASPSSRRQASATCRTRREAEGRSRCSRCCSGSCTSSP